MESLLALESATTPPTDDAPAPCPAAGGEAPCASPLLDAGEIRAENLATLLHLRELTVCACRLDPDKIPGYLKLIDAIEARLPGGAL